MSQLTKGEELANRLKLKRKSVYECVSEQEKDRIFQYADSYRAFLDEGKTEREAVREGIRLAEQHGYKPYRFGEPLKAGDKLYYNNRDKNLFVFKIGSRPIETQGIKIMAAHVDAPRIDIKQNPLYEDSGMCFFKTHYYGGIKKYQWTAIPLALHGTVVLKDGTAVDIKVGEDPGDPVFYINDLLPHLGAEQAQKTLGTAIPGESLNLLVGGMPYPDEKAEEKIKLNVLALLHERYGITEADFMSAELSAVPAFNARDIGFDRALLGAYGHDDRVCAYPVLTALLESEDSENTVLSILADKEETGSDGNTGMNSILIKDLLDQICEGLGANPYLVRAASKCLSADVCAAYDPNFADVYEKRNSAFLSQGTCVVKYTGSRGKSSTNDASAEMVGYVRRFLDEGGVHWQTAELGKVDQGGGGTVAKYIAQYNIDTIDIGVPVISMHAPYEVISKADLYATHQAVLCFIKA
ncbi:MAG: aminopeptidase [Eubacteriales bacterium]